MTLNSWTLIRIHGLIVKDTTKRLRLPIGVALDAEREPSAARICKRNGGLTPQGSYKKPSLRSWTLELVLCKGALCGDMVPSEGVKPAFATSFSDVRSFTLR